MRRTGTWLFLIGQVWGCIAMITLWRNFSDVESIGNFAELDAILRTAELIRFQIFAGAAVMLLGLAMLLISLRARPVTGP